MDNRINVAVYRSIYLESITSLSTHGFLLAFRRFVAQRERPNTVYSDIGTNFIGAKNVFEKIDWKYIFSRIQWKFIFPAAAWWGGWWERIVKIVKNLLRRVLDRASLGFEELSSALCDVESVINSINKQSAKAHEVPPFLLFLQCLRELGILRIFEAVIPSNRRYTSLCDVEDFHYLFFYRCSLTVFIINLT